MKQMLLVFLGGGMGSMLRYWIGLHLNNNFPYGTLLVNILGSLLIGIIFGLTLKFSNISQNTVLFLATGFCGGFTTFSTFAYENYQFVRQNEFMIFALYAGTSVLLGLAFVFFGMWIIKFL